MTTPTSGQIAMSDVGTETGLIEDMYNFFSISQVGGGGGLMYHNLLMGPSNSITAAQAIYDPFTAGPTGGPQNLELSAWYNYSQTPNGILTFSFDNQNLENDITVTVYLVDYTTTPFTYFQIGNPVPTTFFLAAGSGIVNYNDYDTGVAMNTTNFTSGVYVIAFDISANYVGPPPPPGTGVLNNTTSASDTDNRGAGTARATTNPPNFDMTSPITQASLVRGNVGPSSIGIYINKRTTFDLVFN